MKLVREGVVTLALSPTGGIGWSLTVWKLMESDTHCSGPQAQARLCERGEIGHMTVEMW